MSDKAIENGEAFVADALLQESQWDEEEEEEPSQPSSAGSTPGGPPPGPDSTDQPKKKERNFSSTAVKVGAAVAGGVLAMGAAPLVLGAMGFTSAGIAASSIAAKMMSAAAIANGGGVAAGGLVATLQSAGAAGLSLSSNILLGLTGSSIGAWLGSKKEEPSSSENGSDKDGK
ncbi:PREDICTED: interferon alpha-inducible protein 27-like protein 1 [Myotis brandtii]|uniref:interferon alpha-inducible protein 27-like protein 1 n=1 Tax=Myotis brandtii TaxID=109478 RepID=UPI0007041D77|nr:PREDICTED: interferon alpha-inducible protein 27-like protein 1 [Myotis brandtii]XP_014404569.1 PREDICTED: interferon alpha-inducible protein 27-like protein 1 [Myotis brandtii]